MGVSPQKRIVVFAVRLFLAVTVFLGVVHSAKAQSIFVVKGPRGVMTFTTKKPLTSNYKTFTSTRYSRVLWTSLGGHWKTRPVASAFDPLILQVAQSHNLDPDLIKAVVHVESSFQPHARSYKGAMGLMQLMPQTARRFGVTDAYHPDQNVTGGARYLRELLDRYAGNETLAIAAYNAGEGAVDRYVGVPPYSETQQYVRRVLKMRDAYRCRNAGKCTGPVYLD